MDRETRHKPINNFFRATTILFFLSLCSYFSLAPISLFAQDKNVANPDDKSALENVIVEEYYISDSTDYSDKAGGVLPFGSKTYRIYIDMKPDYSLQMVYGDQKHELNISTSEIFFNNEDCRALTGFNIDAKKINENSVALDSWLTLGAATRIHTGIPKSLDKDGSLIKRPALSINDGLTIGNLPMFKVFNLDLNFFNNDSTATNFSTNNGGWGALGGVKGPTAENIVLIAQLTTHGKLSFSINIQLGTPSGGVVKFVAKNPGYSEIQFKGLAYN